MLTRKETVKTFCLFTLCMLTVFLFTLAGFCQNQAKKPEKKGPTTYQIDGEDQDIRQLARIISNITGKNFILDDRVKGRVTIISPKPVTAEEAYKVFESILEVNGFTIVPAGKINKIVPSGEARHKNVTTLFEPEYKKEGEDRVVTQIVPLQFADANELKKLLTPLVSRQGLIASYPPANTLILTDY
ncbi:MAG TPA: type II secretion system protein GspD, partial [Deltaproteobacteria bacterium]|nr:type II secretion system protein GspD [Deltaproteobacteria bacterium]